MKKTFFTLLFSSLLLLFFDKMIGFSLARDITQIIFGPIEIGLHETGLIIHDRIVFLIKLPVVNNENKELKEEIRELQTLHIENEELKNENKDLREQLGVKVEGIRVEVLARVQGEVISGEKVFILINKGKVDGVEVDDIVVKRSFLIGKVASVSRNQARVLPIFSNESKVPAFVFSFDKKINGLAIGEYNGQVKFTEVLQDESLVAGDLVVSSGSAGTFPAGLLIGKIEEVKKDKNELFQEAKLSLFWDMKELGNVFILK